MDYYEVIVRTPECEETLRWPRTLPARGDELRLSQTKAADGRWRVTQVLWGHQAMQGRTSVMLVLEAIG